jgi:hypothetical protein
MTAPYSHPPRGKANTQADLAKIDKIITRAGPRAVQVMVDAMFHTAEDGTIIPNVKVAEKVVAIWAQIFKIKADLQKGEKDALPVAVQEGTQNARFSMTVVNPSTKDSVTVATKVA